jgi:hypothetical protein
MGWLPDAQAPLKQIVLSKKTTRAARSKTKNHALGKWLALFYTAGYNL